MPDEGGFKSNPTEYVDITNEIDLKIEMLKCHKSQIDWLNDHDGTDSIDQIKLVAKFRGMQCGVEYAEAFTQCQAYLKGTTKRLLP